MPLVLVVGCSEPKVPDPSFEAEPIGARKPQASNATATRAANNVSIDRVAPPEPVESQAKTSTGASVDIVDSDKDAS